MRNILLRGLLFGALVLILAGCGQEPAGDVGTEIVSAEEALLILETRDDAVLVDARPGVDYNREHIEGAVSVSRADIVVNSPFPALLAPPEQIENAFGRRGISNDSLILAYDDSGNMDAARLWWTLKVYGHHDVKVVSGGYAALRSAGAQVTSSAHTHTQATFSTEAPDQSMMISAKEIRDWVNDPDPSVFLIDTRSEEEYITDGAIPGAILLDYAGNNFSDGEYRPPRHIRIRYLEVGVDFDDTAYIYCHTSIRAAQTYLAMYNAGYRNLRLYDGAWVEWSANPMNPIFEPEQPTGVIEAPDAS
ncbi:MAG: sulfurtransferase [Spirochaetaceae bacterium]